MNLSFKVILFLFCTAKLAFAQSAVEWGQKVLVNNVPAFNVPDDGRNRGHYGSEYGRMLRLAGDTWLAAYTVSKNYGYLKDTKGGYQLEISLSEDNGRHWKKISGISDEGRDLDNAQMIRLPDRSVLLACRSVRWQESYRLPVYRSTDNGRTWTKLSTIDFNEGKPGELGNPDKGIYEPHFGFLDDGRLSVMYANEKHVTDSDSYSQIISQRISPDYGKTWGEEIWVAYEPGHHAARPGMPVWTKMKNGKYIAVYEVCGPEKCNIYYKISNDGIKWPVGLGTIIPGQLGGPYILSLSDGRLVVTSNQSNISVSDDYGRSWHLTEPAWNKTLWPALYQTGPDEICAMNAVARAEGGHNMQIRFGKISKKDKAKQQSSVINNPVLPGVADAGVIKFNGEYYIGGVFTNGSYYISDDLISWRGPVHVFSMDNEWTEGSSAGDNRIHADDISYINGVFHQYWSVNYWGKDKNVVHIGHATSPDILGPFKEPEKDTWLDNRIDPKLFIDDDRKLYLYMVKFTDGNTIWVRPMKDPSSFSADPTYLFASLPNTWETLDNRVEEGPWVMKYRNRYYLMYNANHTSTAWGNYALGVAEAASPMGFNHGSKYPYPVVQSNQIDLEDTYTDLLKYSGKEPGVFSYTFDQPAGESWKQVNFDASAWEKGKSGFGSEIIKGSTVRKVLTDWKTSAIWLRKSFTLQKKDTGNLMLRIHHDGDTKVFLNGNLIYQEQGRKYITRNLDKQVYSLLKDGENVLTIQSAKGNRTNFLDVSLFDLKDTRGDDILYSPGQPNILRGPNGFEWWLIYMANKNNEPRGQYINRIHFFNRTLYVDGITGINTPGYHPVPALPTFRDLFNGNEDQPAEWDLKTGNWEPDNREMVQKSKTLTALVKSTPSTNYLFEAGVKMADAKAAKAGVYAYQQDEQNWLRVLLDRQNKRWMYILNQDGKRKSFSFSLPDDFNYQVYHTLTVYKNADRFTLNIDGLPAPGNPVIQTGFSGKGIPGVYGECANTAFDGILYTIGWDEFDFGIAGWSVPSGSERSAGLYRVTEDGMILDATAAEQAVFKGDALGQYDYSLQVEVKDDKGSAGMYPVYVDSKNYLKLVIDFKDHKFRVSGRQNGKEIAVKEVSLENRRCYYPDMKYTDFIEKHYTFSSPAYISSIELNKAPYKGPDTLMEDIHRKMDIFYKRHDKWYPLLYDESPSSHPGFDKITFKPVEAEGLRFTNKQGGDTNYYIYKIWVSELAKQSYNLRAAKLKDKIIFFIDGREALQMKNTFPASQVGLIADNTQAAFNGITFFHLPD